MNRHLEDHEIAAAIVGSDLGDAAREHLESCLSCRQEIAAFERLIAARCDHMEGAAPDWDEQQQQILDRLPTRPEVEPIRIRRWMRPALAAAAALVAAIGIGVLQVGNGDGDGQPELVIEEILAEVDATLDSEDVPGFEVLEPIVPGTDDFESFYANGAS